MRRVWFSFNMNQLLQRVIFPSASKSSASISTAINRLFINRNNLKNGIVLSGALQQHRSMSDNSNKLRIQTVTNNDKEDVIKFFLKNFWVDEPLNQYVNLLANPETIKIISKHTVKKVEQNISFLVRNEAGELGGVTLNSVKTKNDSEGDEIKDPRFGSIVKLLGYVDRNAKIFEKFPDVDKVISVDMISVDDKFKGQGIAKMLMDKTRDLARQNGIKLMRVDCSSHFSARASAKLGMECVYELKYSDYIVDGVQVFKPDPPHNEIKVYVQRLDQ